MVDVISLDVRRLSMDRGGLEVEKLTLKTSRSDIRPKPRPGSKDNLSKYQEQESERKHSNAFGGLERMSVR